MMKPSQSACRPAFPWLLLALLVLLVPASPAAFAQALPAAEAAPISTGFALPTTLGTLQYAVSASQSLVWGYYGNSGVSAGTNLGGDLAYLSNSKQHPFSMILAGGRSFSESDQGSYNFANLGLSQVANVGRWNFVLSDSVSYLPGTPVTGLSGIPGVGDLGVSPVQVGADTGQGVLTNYSDRVTNVAAGSVQRQLTGKTAINASGSYYIMRFLDTTNTSANASGAGLDSDAVTGGGGFSHELSVRNTYGANYAYSNYTYPENNFGIFAPGFVSQTASGTYTHRFTRRLSMSVAVGPQFTTVDNSGSPNALSLFASAAASYAAKETSASVAFNRSTNSGYGSNGGALSSSVGFSISRKFAVVWNCSGSASYTNSSNLPVAGVPSYSSNTYVEGIQVSRAIARSLSAFASYTLEDQSFSAASAIDLFSGLSQVVGLGITYSPSALHLGRQ
jgi:hypothetical protein